MKVTRSAFLYLEPKRRDDPGSFAQCSACRMFVPKVRGLDGSRCVIHGSGQEIDGDYSCGFFLDWPAGKPSPEVVNSHARELAANIPGSVLASESGLVDNKVQCHRCDYYLEDGPRCGLYEMLNRKLDDIFDLNTSIERHACCNAWMERDNSAKGWMNRRNLSAKR